MRHGTTSTYYRHRCRCELCRDAMRAYERERRAARRPADGPAPGRPRASGPDALLETLCWCQEKIVRVPTRDVKAGITRTCGEPDCTRIAQSVAS